MHGGGVIKLSFMKKLTWMKSKNHKQKNIKSWLIPSDYEEREQGRRPRKRFRGKWWIGNPRDWANKKRTLEKWLLCLRLGPLIKVLLIGKVSWYKYYRCWYKDCFIYKQAHSYKFCECWQTTDFYRRSSQESTCVNSRYLSRLNHLLVTRPRNS